MNQEPIQNPKHIVRLPLLIAITLASGILIGAGVFGNSHNNDLAKNTTKFREILYWVQNNYVDAVDTDTLVDYSIKKMLEKLDPHTSYIPLKDIAMARSQLEAGFDGIGIEFNIFKDTVYVMNVLPGGPSEYAGLRSGDAILQADSIVLTGSRVNNSMVFLGLRGKKGSQVKLLLKRSGMPPMLVAITRNRIPSFSISAGYLIAPETGYIKIDRFSETTYEEFKVILSNLKSQGMKRLMLDIRGNGGGYMDRATNLVDELLDGNKLIVYTDGKANQYDKQTLATNSGIFEQGAIVVLVDENSASASEIVAGALQDNDRAILVGRRTFGKGLVQMPVPLSDGSELRLTISRYYTPCGRSIQKPYHFEKDGQDKEYDHDYQKREKSGELFCADSMKINKKLAYKTSNGRTVYGGGGIVPDVFVAKDTSMMSGYLYHLWSKNLIREFAFNYAQNNKKVLEKQGFYDFFKNFTLADTMLQPLVVSATAAGIKYKGEEFNRSRKYIALQAKAYIARQVFHKRLHENGLDNEFYQVMNTNDDMVQKALIAFEKTKLLTKKEK